MTVFESLVMGVVQGLTEYLPISSSGHLEICGHLLGLKLDPEQSMEFDVLLHVATVLSTIVVLWREFVPLVTSFFTLKRDSNTAFVWKILLSCIPVLVVGVFFKDFVEGFFAKNLTVIGWCLLITSVLLSFSYFFRTRPLDDAAAGHKPYLPRDISYLDAFIIGCSQALAVLPGLSRSGTTIATGILLGDKREQVARFSFLMVIIPIVGAALLDIKDMLGAPAAEAAAGSGVSVAAMIVGFLSSFIVGCIACKWMLDIVKKGKLVWFAVYCLIVGILCIVL